MLRLFVLLAEKTAKYESWPCYNRWLAGIHAVLWHRFCGWTWRDCLHIGMIHWKPFINFYKED